MIPVIIALALCNQTQDKVTGPDTLVPYPNYSYSNTPYYNWVYGMNPYSQGLYGANRYANAYQYRSPYYYYYSVAPYQYYQPYGSNFGSYFTPYNIYKSLTPNFNTPYSYPPSYNYQPYNYGNYNPYNYYYPY